MVISVITGVAFEGRMRCDKRQEARGKRKEERGKRKEEEDLL
jgi:hypothetical protein